MIKAIVKHHYAADTKQRAKSVEEIAQILSREDLQAWENPDDRVVALIEQVNRRRAAALVAQGVAPRKEADHGE